MCRQLGYRVSCLDPIGYGTGIDQIFMFLGPYDNIVLAGVPKFERTAVKVVMSAPISATVHM